MMLPGDLVKLRFNTRVGMLGIVIAVTSCIDRASISSAKPSNYQRVYYVFFHDGKFEGPLFQSELLDA